MDEVSDNLMHNVSKEERRKKEDDELSNERIEQILSVLHRLNPREQKLFKMKYFAEKSHRKIADVVMTTENSVKVEMARIRKKIRSFL